MANTTQAVIFRSLRGETPEWQYYSMPESVVGGADSLEDAKLRYREALAFALDSDEASLPAIREFIEVEAPEDSGIWIRTDMSWPDPSPLVRGISNTIAGMPEADLNELQSTVAASGDTIVIPTQPTDPLQTILDQVTQYDSVLVVTLAAFEDGTRFLLWLPMEGFGAARPEGLEPAVGLSEMRLTGESLMRDVFQAAHMAHGGRLGRVALPVPV